MMITEIAVKYIAIGLTVACLSLATSTVFYKLSRDSAKKDVALQIEKTKNVEKSLEVEKANRGILTQAIDRQNIEISELNNKIVDRKKEIEVFQEVLTVERSKSQGFSKEILRLRAIPTEDNCMQADALFNKYR